MSILIYGLVFLAGWLMWFGLSKYLQKSRKRDIEQVREAIRKKAELVEQFAEDQINSKKEKT